MNNMPQLGQKNGYTTMGVVRFHYDQDDINKDDSLDLDDFGT